MKVYLFQPREDINFLSRKRDPSNSVFIRRIFAQSEKMPTFDRCTAEPCAGSQADGAEEYMQPLRERVPHDGRLLPGGTIPWKWPADDGRTRGEGMAARRRMAVRIVDKIKNGF